MLETTIIATYPLQLEFLVAVQVLFPTEEEMMHVRVSFWKKRPYIERKTGVYLSVVTIRGICFLQRAVYFSCMATANTLGISWRICSGFLEVTVSEK